MVAISSSSNQAQMPARSVLLVEDDAEIREAVGFILLRAGYFVLPAATAAEALDAISFVPLDLVLSDVVLPYGSGFDVAFHAGQVRPPLPVILMSSYVAADMVNDARRLGVCQFVQKPAPAQAILEAVAGAVAGKLPNSRRRRPGNVTLHPATGTVRGLLRLISMRDAYTMAHSGRVRRMAGRLARAMGLPPDTVAEITLAGWVHDVGKVSIPADILNKPGALSPAEVETIRHHSAVGAEMLASLGLPRAVVAAVRHHHERYDGARQGRTWGYPDGLAGEQIPLAARVLTVVDSFDAMTTHRIYRPGASRTEALDEIERLAGGQFDPAIVRVFLEMMRTSLTPC